MLYNHCILQVIGEKDDEYDIEIHYKDTFKAFSKDKDGKSKQAKDTKSNVQIFVIIRSKMDYVTPSYNKLYSRPGQGKRVLITNCKLFNQNNKTQNIQQIDNEEYYRTKSLNANRYYKVYFSNAGPINIFIGCISAEELQFVMNHLPGKVMNLPTAEITV